MIIKVITAEASFFILDESTDTIYLSGLLLHQTRIECTSILDMFLDLILEKSEHKPDREAHICIGRKSKFVISISEDAIDEISEQILMKIEESKFNVKFYVNLYELDD